MIVPHGQKIRHSRTEKYIAQFWQNREMQIIVCGAGPDFSSGILNKWDGQRRECSHTFQQQVLTPSDMFAEQKTGVKRLPIVSFSDK